MAILNFPYSIKLRLAIQFCEMKKTMFIYTVYMLRGWNYKEKQRNNSEKLKKYLPSWWMRGMEIERDSYKIQEMFF